MLFYIFPGSLGYQFRRRADFIYIVKSQLQQSIQNNVYVVQVIILGIARRSRKSYRIFEIIDHGERIIDWDLSMVRTVSDASAAVDTELVYDMGFPVMYPDRLGGAVFDAVDTSLTGRFPKPYGTYEFIIVHSFSPFFRIYVLVLYVLSVTDSLSW